MQTEAPPGCRRRGHDEAAASAAGSWGHSLGPSFLVVYVWLVGFFSAELYADVQVYNEQQLATNRKAFDTMT